MENLPDIHLATGQKQGLTDDVVLPISSPMNEAMLASPLSCILQKIPNRGMTGNSMQFLIHIVDQNDKEMNRLREINEVLQEKNNDLTIERGKLRENLAVANERLESRGYQNLFKAFLTVFGGAAAGFGIDIYKSESVSNNGLILFCIGIAILLINEVWSVWQGFRK